TTEFTAAESERGSALEPSENRRCSLAPVTSFRLTHSESISTPRWARSSKKPPNIGDLGDFNIYPNDLMKTTESVIQGMSEVVKRGGFPVVMGGDHYVAYPSFEGYAKGFAERKKREDGIHPHRRPHRFRRQQLPGRPIPPRNDGAPHQREPYDRLQKPGLGGTQQPCDPGPVRSEAQPQPEDDHRPERQRSGHRRHHERRDGDGV
ncbi:MAG TPA: hypothetical protein EYN53_01825, partial [Dehalococcoidia bacterium]|nr:hypothetical protein [Dehalococcoidia bacterium]